MPAPDLKGYGLGHVHANEILEAACESGIPAVNVGGGYAAGAIAVHEAFTMVASGQCNTIAAVGAERMPKGFIPRPPGLADDISDSDYLGWVAMGATNPDCWALEARRRMHDFGYPARDFCPGLGPDAYSSGGQSAGALPSGVLY